MNELDYLDGASETKPSPAVACATPRLGSWLATGFARYMAWRRSTLYRTVRSNLAHVLGAGASAQELDTAAERAIYHAGRSYYDLLRIGLQECADGRAPIRHDPAEWERTLAVLRGGRGTVLVGPHVGSFDLGGQWIAAQGVEMQTLSLAEPSIANQVQNWLRRRRGMIVTPVGLPALRAAMQRLRRGGVVVTGVDRPVSPDDGPVPFFDAPARLPDGHVRLALQTDAQVVAASCILQPDGCWMLHLAPPIEMERSGDREADVRHNMRRVLAIVEELIRMAPDQWLMFVPVWAEPGGRAGRSR